MLPGARAARLAVLRMGSPDPVGFGAHAVEPRRVALKSVAGVSLPLILATLQSAHTKGGPTVRLWLPAWGPSAVLVHRCFHC